MSGPFFMMAIAVLNVLAGVSFIMNGQKALGMSNIFFAMGYAAFALSFK